MKKYIFLLSLLCSVTTYAQDFSVFLIGDTGEPKFPEDKNLKFLESKLDNASENDILIFLGDNIYPKGLPDEEHPDRLEMEKKFNPSLDVMKKFKGKKYMIMGNHDWAQGKSYGWENVKNMGEYVTQYVGEGVVVPTGGCPGPVEVPLTPETTLILMDFQYFLQPGPKPRSIDGCEPGGTLEAIESLKDMVIRNSNKHILIAAHHPLYSYGPHGGKYNFLKTNLFPLTEAKSMRNLYIPLPGLGTIYWFGRAVVGNIQDIPHPKYKAIRNFIVEILEEHGQDIVWANGHEHSLQYIQKGKSHYVVSGSGSKTSRVVEGKGTQFYKKERGFAELRYRPSGEVNLKFWGGDSESLLYESNIYQKDVVTDRQALENRPQFEGQTITVAASSQYEIGKGGQKWLGENYRKTWATPIEVPVFDVKTERGGLDILKKGGGRQTTSLRMEADNGKQYVLRSINKDPSALLPKPLKKTFAADFLQDQISSSHPYAAVAVPPMADAVGVYHANPSLVYVPDDPAFGDYQYAFKNQLFLYEERPNDEAAVDPYFGQGDDVKGTLDMLDREIYDDNDNWIDQKFVLKSRLFDMVIGDWDRHDDQWRWVGRKNEDGKGRRYRPIPRDRDQAFFVTNGFLPKIAASKWAVPSSEGFNEKMRWAPGFNWNMRWFDRTFLTELEWQDWQEQIDYIQENLTDKDISDALKNLPGETYDITAPRIERVLKSRRDGMETYARELYEFLSKEVEIVGSDKHEHFSVKRIDDNQTEVTVRKRSKDGELQQVMYNRTFLHNETKEIRLYGLGGQDVFEVEGEVRKGMKVRIIGGKKKDVIIDKSNVKSGGKKTIVYDKIDKTEVTTSQETKLKLSDDPEVNLYDRKSYVYDKTFPLANVQFNPDNGLYLGAGFLFTDYGWRKKPFRSQHMLLVNGALGIDSYNFRYTGKFTDVIGKWGLALEVEQQEPFFISNFFGYGNESVYDRDTDNGFEDAIDFYRIQTDRGFIMTNFYRPIGTKSQFNIAPTYRLAEVSRQESDRFLAEANSGVDIAKVAEQHVYVGFNSGFQFDGRDNKALPTAGTFFRTNIERLWGTNERSEDLTRLNASLSQFISVKFPARLVIANRVGVEHLFENDFEFFNAPFLGGWTNLRAFRRTRFHGQTAFYHNLDLRLRLFSFTTYIFPGHVGLLGYQDVGRVWFDGEDSDTWHISRGAGAYISPLNQFVISFEKGFTDEEDPFLVRFGFFF